MASENREEALKCLKIIKDSIASGNLSRAHEFRDKARKLYPSIIIHTDDLFSNLDANKYHGSSSSSSSGARRRVPASTTTYTIKQLTVIQEILMNKKDYYKIMGLKRSCSTKDAHKAYKKLCLEVHPDKNSAPGADEAFKMLSKAFQCLSNEESRKNYDRTTGSHAAYDERTTNNNNGGGGGWSEEPVYERSNNNGYYGGGASRPRSGYYYCDQNFNYEVPIWKEIAPFVFILLSLVMMLVVINPDLDINPPIYSMTMSDSHNYSLTTKSGVTFYATSAEFEQQHPPNSPERLAIEHKVERIHHIDLFRSCREEMKHFCNWGTRRESPECDVLRRFEAVLI